MSLDVQSPTASQISSMSGAMAGRATSPTAESQACILAAAAVARCCLLARPCRAARLATLVGLLGRSCLNDLHPHVHFRCGTPPQRLAHNPHPTHAPTHPHACLPPSSTPQPAFMRFAERHRRLINVLVHHKPELLHTSMALLLRAPKLLDFDNK